ncbi:DUF2202 domain-containing protein [Salinibacterium sp. TMP30]|uniref:DUF2202 domain-containing protein n=1 Tax=Salinibacterium sp. TMP30 TaxID=3138237 RepID=UPI003138EA11
MRKGTIITTSIIGGVLAVTLVAGASFALGASNNDNESSTGSGQSGHGQSGHGQNGSDSGMGGGSNSSEMGRGAQKGHESGTNAMDGLTGVESGTLTSEQEATLSLMAEEEKVAHDLYVAFGDLYGDKVFDRVSNAETKHLSAVQVLLERYDLADPTVGLAPGEFSSESMQELYDSLFAQGSVSRDGAFEAARTIEKNDISDIAAAAESVTAPDVLAVYSHLLSGSEKHLNAFGG